MLEAERRIRTLVVDDEPLAREGLRLLLAGDEDIEVVGEAGSGKAALAALRRLRPDLVFLDVQMPELSGFEVLSALPRESWPAVVFVTAYDRYALRAFEVHALDYLLKPFDDQRFADALARAKRHLRLARVSDLSQRLAALLEPAPAAARVSQRLSIRDAGRVLFLEIDEIDWIEAADYYVQLHVGAKSYLHREPMRDLEARLDPRRFVRIHRSTIVAIDRVAELRPSAHGDHCVRLRDGTDLKLSRARRGRLRVLLAMQASRTGA